MKKVVISIDSFKGSLSSAQANAAAAIGVANATSSYDIQCISVADGGEGILDIFVQATGGTLHSADVTDPLMQPLRANFGVSKDRKTAFVEMASASGLPLVPVAQRNPLYTSSFGTGLLIKAALDYGCRNVVIGLGGSATNDAGTGMLQALGFRFLDRESNELMGNGESLINICTIDMSNVYPAVRETTFTLACDVQNRFFGSEGAAYVFAPQKGATPQMIVQLDEGLRNFAKVTYETTGIYLASIPGAGAAGGMGGGCVAFLNATVRSGIDLLLDTIGFDEQIKDAELIITGEGAADKQTIMGKVPYGILKRAKRYQVPVVLIAGSISDVKELNEAGFTAVFSIMQRPMALENALNSIVAANAIEIEVCQLFKLFDLQKRTK